MGDASARVCVFCGGEGPLTLEHVFPQWALPYLRALGQPRTAVRSDSAMESHHAWRTSAVDLKARKICGRCNGGWMSAIESRARPILGPLIRSTGACAFTDDEAVVLGTWVAKTVLTASLLHANEGAAIPRKYYREMFLERKPFQDCVIWIAPYEVGEYPVSSSAVAIPDIEGFRVTGNVGCLAYQLTGGEGMKEGGLVIPPENLKSHLTQIWPLLSSGTCREIDELLMKMWPGASHRGRAPGGMNDAELRELSEIGTRPWRSGTGSAGVP